MIEYDRILSSEISLTSTTAVLSLLSMLCMQPFLFHSPISRRLLMPGMKERTVTAAFPTVVTPVWPSMAQLITIHDGHAKPRPPWLTPASLR